MPQPYMPDSEQHDETIEGFPEVGDVLSIMSEDQAPKIMQIMKDHGPARIYTVKDSDEQEHLVALDKDGCSWTIGEDDE